MSMLIRLVLAALLGLAAAALISCGSSGKGLIPLADAGPLKSDFEAVTQAAQTGDGDCTTTTEAINKTERDFAALPATIDAGLRGKLSEGISNLRERALSLCKEPLAPTTTVSTARTTTTTQAKTQTTTAPPPTQTTSTQTPTTTTTTTTSTPPSNNGGGTAAPGERPAGSVGPGGGTGAGETEEASAGEPGGNGLGPGNGRGKGQ